MLGSRRVSTLSMALVLCAGLVPFAGPTAGAPVDDPRLAGTTAVPDPVIFAPEADRAERLHHPEAMLGRDARLAIEPPESTRVGTAATPIARWAPMTPAPDETAPGPIMPAASPVVADGPERPFSAPRTGMEPEDQPIAAAAVAQVKGTIRDLAGEAVAGILVCLDEVGGQYCIASAATGMNGAYAIDATAGSYRIRTYDASETYAWSYWSPTGSVLQEAEAGVIDIVASDITGIDITVRVFPEVDGHPARGALHDHALDRLRAHQRYVDQAHGQAREPGHVRESAPVHRRVRGHPVTRPPLPTARLAAGRRYDLPRNPGTSEAPP
jgi:hypothetical protein